MMQVVTASQVPQLTCGSGKLTRWLAARWQVGLRWPTGGGTGGGGGGTGGDQNPAAAAPYLLLSEPPPT